MTTVTSGTTVSNQDVTSGATLEVQSGGVATGTTIEGGGTELVDQGGSDSTAIVKAGGLETVNGTADSDDVSGTLNVTATGVVTNVTIENGGSVNITAKGGTVSNATVNAGGLLTINHNAAANSVTLQGGTLEIESAKADMNATGPLTFAPGFASTLQIDVAQQAVPTFAQTISGFAAGDVIDQKGLTFAGGSFTASTSGGITAVTVTGGSFTGSQTFNLANVSASSVSVVADSSGGSEIVIVCYVSGTLIRTATGDVPVETLAVGDLVVTASGAHRPIRWIGHRDTDCARHPEPRKVWPVRVRSGALGAGLPYADLWLSPGHALCLDEVLIPVRCLIHGDAISQVGWDSVIYWHVELDTHDILIANGVAAESYLDTGNRPAFDNAPGPIDLHPDFEPRYTTGFCRPYVQSGPLLSAARARLFGGAAAPVSEPIHMLADGIALRGMVGAHDATFLIPAGTRDLRLVSPSFRGGGDDIRKLGLNINSLRIEDMTFSRDVELDDPTLFAGFHDVETDGTTVWRWTDGDAHFAPNLWEGLEGAFLLRIGGMFEAARKIDETQAQTTDIRPEPTSRSEHPSPEVLPETQVVPRLLGVDDEQPPMFRSIVKQVAALTKRARSEG